MKTEEDAFWMLAVLLENVLVSDCYTDTLSGCHVEQRVFKDLLAKKCPRYFFPPSIFMLVFLSENHAVIVNYIRFSKWYRIAAHLEAMGFDVSLVATEWFLCLFSKTLPSEVRQQFTWNQCLSFRSMICRELTVKPFNSYHFCCCEQTTLRVWDVLFNEGAKVLFHVALAIFKVCTKKICSFHVFPKCWVPSACLALLHYHVS